MSTRQRASLRAKRLTLFACLMVVSAALFFFGPAERSLACPEPPTPLRPLYVASQSVVVARADKSVVLQTEKIDPEDDYERTLLRTTFYISKTLKSKDEAEQVVHVYSWLWGEDHTVPENYAEGKRLLLFLAPREEGDGYELVDNSYGAKDLSDDDLKVYVERLEELGKIMSAPKPDKAEIVEWLVRCAEEPATRWEGAYELLISQDFLTRETDTSQQETVEEEAAVVESQSDAEVASAEVEEATTEETQVEETVSVEEDLSSYSAEMARLLTAGQKKRLADALFKLPEFKDEDWSLFTLVQNWGDERLIGFILSNLERVQDNPDPYTNSLVIALAGELKDEKLSALAKKFCDYASYKEVEDAAVNGNKGRRGGEEEVVTMNNFARKRSARLKDFLAQARSVMDNRIAMAGENSQ